MNDKTLEQHCTNCKRKIQYGENISVINYGGLGDDNIFNPSGFYDVYCEECTENHKVAHPEPLGQPITMIKGIPHLECDFMPCNFYSKYHAYCVMPGDDCELINNIVIKYGSIVGMRIIKYALDKWEPGYSVEVLLYDAVEAVTGTDYKA